MSFRSYVIQNVGAINVPRLMSEIKDVLGKGPSGFILGERSTLTLQFEAISDSEFDTVKAVIEGHQPDALHLPTVKEKKNNQVDAKTRELISKGFVYNGMRFSLSDNSQRTLLGLDMLRNDPALTYPIRYNTIDDKSSVSLANAGAVHQFFLASIWTFRSIWDAGTALKDQIRTATSVEQVNSIEDTRT